MLLLPVPGHTLQAGDKGLRGLGEGGGIEVDHNPCAWCELRKGPSCIVGEASMLITLTCELINCM